MATHSNIPAWRIPWREEPGGLQSMGSQNVRHNGLTCKTTLNGENKERNKRFLPLSSPPKSPEGAN